MARGSVALRTAKYARSRGRIVSDVPDDLLYVSSHEWIRVEGDEATIGITDHAQAALNDIVYVELPGVGDQFTTDDEFGVVESVKSVSDLFMPLAGEIIASNEALEDAPETINTDPYGEGWLIKIKLTDPTEVATLLSPDDYKAEIA